MSDVPETDPTATRVPDGGGPAAGTDGDGEQVMDLLAERVPLALLVDLITPEGPASADILRTEGMPDDAWWEPATDAPDAGAGPASEPATEPASGHAAGAAGAGA